MGGQQTGLRMISYLWSLLQANASSWTFDVDPADCDQDNETLTQVILHHIFHSYDNNVVPSTRGVDVQVEVMIQAIQAISEITASFTTDFMFSQIWHDERLSYSQITNCLQNITLSHNVIHKIWLPNVCFVNSKSSFVHQSPTPNIFLLIFPNGTVWVSFHMDPMYIPKELNRYAGIKIYLPYS